VAVSAWLNTAKLLRSENKKLEMNEAGRKTLSRKIQKKQLSP